LIKKNDKPETYIDLESDADFYKLIDAETYLIRFSGQLLIIDLVQRKSDIFGLLRVVIDDRKRNGVRTGNFLILGSAS
jgi:hypothetical protein